MTSGKDIEKELAELGGAIGSDQSLVDKVMAGIEDKPITDQARTGVWPQVISRIGKIAAAAAVIALVFWFTRSTERDVWADMCRAFEKVECVHMEVVGTQTDGQTVRYESWIKKPNLLRNENPEQLIIDNGLERLELNKRHKTAQISDSTQDRNPQVKSVFAFVTIIQGGDPNNLPDMPVLSKVEAESNDTVLVYDAYWEPKPNVHRSEGKMRIWVDTETLLIQTMVASAEDSPEIDVSSVEYSFDYGEIDDAMFSLVIPDGYRELPRQRRTTVSGTVFDNSGNPVGGANVYVSDGLNHLRGQTDTDGHFELKCRFQFDRLRFPVLIRAISSDTPGEVAWTMIEDPGKQGQLDITPPDCGDIELTIDPNRSRQGGNCKGINGIIVKMQPALEISGTVRNKMSQPISGAKIVVKGPRLRYKDRSDVFTMGTGVSAMTDDQGAYVLRGLPNLPEGIELDLKVTSDGYVRAGKQVTLDGSLAQTGPDFALLAGGVTIKGVVKNSSGENLPLCQIWHSVKGKTLGEVRCNTEDDGWEGTHGFTGRNGEFELVNCPAMEGLSVNVSGAAKCPFWDFKMGIWKMDREFVAYDEKTVDIGYEPGTNEYYVEIVLGEPDTKIEFEIKDADGNAVANAEVSLNPTYDSLAKYITKTDESGRCVLENIPWMEKVRLEVRPSRQGRRYRRIYEIIELSENVDNYIVEIVLPERGKYVDQNITVHGLAE